jgi:hypothetical protein
LQSSIVRRCQKEGQQENRICNRSQLPICPVFPFLQSRLPDLIPDENLPFRRFAGLSPMRDIPMHICRTPGTG